MIPFQQNKLDEIKKIIGDLFSQNYLLFIKEKYRFLLKACY